MSVSGGHQLEPSVSSDGAYIALVRNASGSKVMRFRKSNSSYTNVVSGSSSVNLRHPSVSNGGGKVMWLEENVSNSGSRIRVKTLSSGQYSFTSVPADSYFVVAYVDGNSNSRQDSTERAGAFGSAAVPQVINATSGSYTANITTGTPTEVEPNNGLSTTNRLLLTTHLNGSFSGTNYD